MGHIFHPVKVVIDVIIQTFSRGSCHNGFQFRVTGMIIGCVMIGCGGIIWRSVTIFVPFARRFGTGTDLFSDGFRYMFDNLHWYFIAHFFGYWRTNLFGYFSGGVDRVFDTDCFGKVFTGFSRNKDGEILALFFWHFFTLGFWHLFFNFDRDLKMGRKWLVSKKNRNCSSVFKNAFPGILKKTRLKMLSV